MFRSVEVDSHSVSRRPIAVLCIMSLAAGFSWLLAACSPVAPAPGVSQPTPTVPPAVLVENTRSAITQALAAYGAGEEDRAYELAASAYLDGFEHMEADLLGMNQQELVESMETQFKAFRDGIKAKQPREELEALSADLQKKLDQVDGLLK